MNTTNDSGRKRVLIVDDEEGILVVLERALRMESYEVQVARDGAEGWRWFAEGSWDLVITDRAMPELDGEELAERIRALKPGTPVILITGFRHLVQHQELYAVVLPKPFLIHQLLTAVQQALSKGGARAPDEVR